MNYIVLDLEWNQCPYGKAKANKDLTFEIIEIGAVKLNEKFEIIDEFDEIVRPQVYKSLHYIIKDMLDFTNEELLSGLEFEDAFKKFIKWCGNDYMFCTFGPGDLVELQKNMKFYNIDNKFPMPFKFYDIQKVYSIIYDDGKIRKSLQTVIEERKLNINILFHRAINDAKYTAALMQNMDFEKGKEYYSVDNFKIPYNKNQEIRLIYPTYEKYISRGYKVREKALKNKLVTGCQCYICNNECTPVIPMFLGNSKAYYGLFKCSKHGFVKTRIRAKEAENGKFYVVKITKLTDKDGAKKIRERQEAIREKRKEKRHHTEK